MASIISVDTLQDSAGSNEITTANVKTAFDDRVKAWVNFNGTGTVAIRDSNNISSLTDNGVGTFTISYSNSMANSNYSGSSGVATSSSYSQGSFRFGGDARGITYSTTSLKLISVDGPSTVDLDCDYCSASIHGDLA